MDVILVDDEIKSLAVLEYHLNKYCEGFDIVDKYLNISDALTGIEKFKPEVVFLDINMPQGTGLDLLEKINGLDIMVVFLTAHAEYAIDAIKLDAFDYLLKPINITELQRVYKKIQDRSIKDKDSSNKIRFQVSKKQYIYHADEIIYAQSQGNYTTIYFANDKPLMLTKNLKKIETLYLTDPCFFRSHQSFIVNINHVEKYSAKDIQLSQNHAAKLASKKYKDLSKLLA